jgi:RNA recognition motif-containing protein
MGTKLYVGNLAYATTEDELRTFFEQAGTVTSVAIPTDRETGRPRGFGFVEMGTEEEAQRAINQLNGQSLGGRPLNVNESRPREPGRGGYGGGGGFGGGGGYSGGGYSSSGNRGSGNYDRY